MCSTGVVGAAGVAAAVDALAALDPVDLPDATLGAELLALRVQLDRLEGQWLRRLQVFDARGGGAGEGYLSTRSWLLGQARLGAGAAGEALRVARSLHAGPGGAPAVGAALAAGEISYTHARVLTRELAALAPGVEPGVAGQAEAALVAVARGLDPLSTRAAAVRLRHLLDAEAVRGEEDAVAAAGRLHISALLDGRHVLDGVAGGEDAAVILTALRPLAVPTPGDRRTGSQRMLAALVELCRRALDGGGLPESGGERPHLNVTVDLDTLHTRPPGAPANPGPGGTGGFLAVALHAGAAGATLEGAGPISAEAARRFACDAAVSRILTAGPSEILDVGRRTRTVPPALRRALAVRDGRCRGHGCTMPVAWTDAHHIVHWADGGQTCLTNLVLLCRRHHRLLHTGSWQVIRQAHGVIDVVPAAHPP